MRALTTPILLALCFAAAAGCAGAPEGSTDEDLSSTAEQPIVNGTPATGFGEAALVDMGNSICSGSLIAPRIALTAGHCVQGQSRWVVRVPSVGASAVATRSWTQYVSSSQSVDPNKVDVGILILDTPINLASYTPLANAAVPNGTSAVNVGRIRNGVASNSQLFVGQSVTLSDAARIGYPLSYVSSEIIESGDSGGPVYVGTGASRRIVAVNSGAGGGTQVLARVDLVYATIQDLIARNGGPGGSTSTPSPTPTPTPTPTPGCVAEAESNDAYTQANALAACRSGSVGQGGDVDWYTWTVGAGSVTYDLQLTATGDADLLLWKNAGGSYSRIANTTATRVNKTSASAGTYVVAVRSAGGQAQTYKLTLAR